MDRERKDRPNRLINEKSPYLLQHAYNPVDWYPWGDEAFEVAQQDNKAVFLSIGYSTCHWCHVMAHESFEDPEIARLMNDAFVCIKVDREERPDIDSFYMNVCQFMTGSGGWPLTVIMTADKRPFFAGTYFPKENRYGRIGMRELVPRIKGIDKEFVITAVDFLQGKKQAGDNVAVIGGGAIGAETALHMARMGKKVTLIEMLAYIAADVFDESRKLLLLQMDKFGVTQLLESKVTEFTDGGVIIETRSGKKKIKVDTVVLALGLRPETRLLDELCQTGRKVVAIGDCVAPRKILEAIWEGYRRARIV